MQNKAAKKAIEIFKKLGGVLKTREALRHGIQPRTLYFLRDRKIIEQLGRGLFRLAEMPPLSNQDLVTVAKQIPKGIICLISALNFYELTSHVPHYIYVAYQHNWFKPKIDYPPIKIFRYSENSYNAGIKEHIIDGIKVKIYLPEKTIADCFKFRNKIGLDVAIEALKIYWQKQKNPNINLILKYAKICRAEKIIRPYLESLVHE